MAGIELVLLLLTASAALQLVARRLHLPHPVLLVVGGAVLATIPGLPAVTLSPDAIFLIFIPLLLYVSALGTSLRDFEAEFWPILRLAVLLVLITVAAVGVPAHWLTPEFTWPAAFALAAIVSPPDAIAATAAMRPLGVPSALVSILEGEGMLNDATALVVYRIAVVAAVTGTFSPGHAALRLLLTGAAGVVIGLAVAMAILWPGATSAVSRPSRTRCHSSPRSPHICRKSESPARQKNAEQDLHFRGMGLGRVELPTSR